MASNITLKLVETIDRGGCAEPDSTRRRAVADGGDSREAGDHRPELGDREKQRFAWHGRHLTFALLRAVGQNSLSDSPMVPAGQSLGAVYS